MKLSLARLHIFFTYFERVPGLSKFAYHCGRGKMKIRNGSIPYEFKKKIRKVLSRSGFSLSRYDRLFFIQSSQNSALPAN